MTALPLESDPEVMEEAEKSSAKRELRRNARRRRRQLPAALLAGDSQAIAVHIRQSSWWPGLRWLHSYVNSLPGEVATDQTIVAALAAGVQVVVPCVEPQQPVLRHARIDSLAQLQAGPHGLLQPTDPTYVTDLAIIDAVLVPGLLFDRRGFRIGQGGGFYDRFLAVLPEHTITVGLTFDDFLVDRIPEQAHDVAVQLVITPTGIFDTQQQRTLS